MKNKNFTTYIAIGIVLILVVLGYIYFFSSPSPDLNPEGYIKEILAEEYGYDVIDLGTLNNNEVFVKLKTFGDKEEQARTSVLVLSVWYPTADKYKIQIVFSGRDCYYEFNGEEYRTNMDNLKNTNEDEAIDSLHRLDNMIINSEVCY